MHSRRDHAEEAFDVVLPADRQSTKVMEPGKKSFLSPTPTVATQGTAILSGFPALDRRSGQFSVSAIAWYNSCIVSAEGIDKTYLSQNLLTI